MKILITFIVTLVCSYLVIPHTLPKPPTFNVVVQNLVVQQEQPLMVDDLQHTTQISVNDLMFADLLKFKYLTDEFRYELVDLINKAAIKFDTDPKLIYSFIRTESAFNIRAKHTPVYVKALGQKVQAIGLGAVIWEFWGDELLANTTLTKKSDLKDYRKNIEATAYIISALAQKEKHKKAKNDIDTIAIWYFGKYNYDYVSKINYHYANLDL